MAPLHSSLGNKNDKSSRKKNRRVSYSSSQRECFQRFSIQYYVGREFVIDGFYYMEVCPWYANLTESFNHKGMVDLSNVFSASIEMIM